MDALTVKSRVTEHLLAHSGFEAGRKYLGMSRIHECPLRLWRECLNGRQHEISIGTARRCYRGYLFEGDALVRLEEAGVCKPDSGRELVADFDDRFRGHTDGETVDGDLLEIKSLRDDTFVQVARSGRALEAHYDQVQLYMRYGNYTHALVFYISTETFRQYVVDVYPDLVTQEHLIEKAQKILAAVDSGQAPGCTCGRCFGAGRGR